MKFMMLMGAIAIVIVVLVLLYYKKSVRQCLRRCSKIFSQNSNESKSDTSVSDSANRNNMDVDLEQHKKDDNARRMKMLYSISDQSESKKAMSSDQLDDSSAKSLKFDVSVD